MIHQRLTEGHTLEDVTREECLNELHNVLSLHTILLSQRHALRKQLYDADNEEVAHLHAYHLETSPGLLPPGFVRLSDNKRVAVFFGFVWHCKIASASYSATHVYVT